MKIFNHIVLFCLFSLVLSSVSLGSVIYVDDDAPDASGNGSSWETSYKYLQDALANVESGDEIWVAQGTYKPDQGGGKIIGDRTASFELKDDMSIYGGYAGIGTVDPNERDIYSFLTTLSGDLDEDDTVVSSIEDLLNDPNRYENSYRILKSYLSDEFLLDGLIITGGFADGVDTYAVDNNTFGAGFIRLHVPNSVKKYCTIQNCRFIGNYAKGNYGVGTFLYCNLLHCEFQYNCARGLIGSDPGFGGVGRFDNGTKVFSCTFRDNFARVRGGAVELTGGSAQIEFTQCYFRGNETNGNGGAIYSHYSIEPIISGCTFERNVADQGGAIFCGNTIIYGFNKVVRSSFLYNSARIGGAITVGVEGYINVVSCNISFNEAIDAGGGIYEYYSDTCHIILTNCRIQGNVSNKNYGAIDGGGKMDLFNCTIWDNHADGSVGGVKGGNIRNCILWRNSDANGMAQSAQSSGCSIAYSCVQNWTGGGTGNISDDPLDIGLAEGSPCIDAGDNASVPNDLVDLDGDGDTSERTPLDMSNRPRFVGHHIPGQVDMGAEEYNPAGGTATLTIVVEPSMVDTTYPYKGQYVYPKDRDVGINAERFVDCPYVYRFDHWEGEVTDPNSAETVVTMNEDKTVTAVFIDDRKCGDECHSDTEFGDFNNDCIVDLADFAKFAERWMSCTKPECDLL